MTDLQTLVRDRPAASPLPGSDNRNGVVSDIAEMLGRQFVVYSAHRLASLAARLDMPLNDLKALEIVIAFESISTGQLAQVLGVSSGGVTALINRLEIPGYVVRGRHPLDRRIIVIQPGPACRQELSTVPAMAGEHAAKSASRYDLRQLETVQTFLSECARRMKEETMRWMDAGHNLT